MKNLNLNSSEKFNKKLETKRISILKLLKNNSNSSTSNSNSSTSNSNSTCIDSNSSTSSTSNSSTSNSNSLEFPTKIEALSNLTIHRDVLSKFNSLSNLNFLNRSFKQFWKPLIFILTKSSNSTSNSNLISSSYNLHTFFPSNSNSSSNSNLESNRLTLSSNSIICLLENQFYGQSLVLKITGTEISNSSNQSHQNLTSFHHQNLTSFHHQNLTSNHKSSLDLISINFNSFKSHSNHSTWLIAMENSQNLKKWLNSLKQIVHDLKNLEKSNSISNSISPSNHFKRSNSLISSINSTSNLSNSSSTTTTSYTTDSLASKSSYSLNSTLIPKTNPINNSNLNHLIIQSPIKSNQFLSPPITNNNNLTSNLQSKNQNLQSNHQSNQNHQNQNHLIPFPNHPSSSSSTTTTTSLPRLPLSNSSPQISSFSKIQPPTSSNHHLDNHHIIQSNQIFNRFGKNKSKKLSPVLIANKSSDLLIQLDQFHSFQSQYISPLHLSSPDLNSPPWSDSTPTSSESSEKSNELNHPSFKTQSNSFHHLPLIEKRHFSTTINHHLNSNSNHPQNLNLFLPPRLPPPTTQLPDLPSI